MGGAIALLLHLRVFSLRGNWSQHAEEENQ